MSGTSTYLEDVLHPPEVPDPDSHADADADSDAAAELSNYNELNQVLNYLHS